MIDHELLTARGGITICYKKNQPIFFEGNQPAYYYQVMEGSVRMLNTNEAGKEFLQGIFVKDQSFGEPVLLIEAPYPASAIANEDSIIIKISKESFLTILEEFPSILLQFARVFAQRVYNNSIITKR